MIIVKWQTYFWVVLGELTMLALAALLRDLLLVNIALVLLGVTFVFVRVPLEHSPAWRINFPNWAAILFGLVGGLVLCALLKLLAIWLGLSWAQYVLLVVILAGSLTFAPVWSVLVEVLGNWWRAIFGERKQYYRALLHQRGGRSEKAAAGFSKQAQRDPSDVDAITRHVRSLIESGKLKDALEQLIAAIERLPQDVSLRKLRSNVLAGFGVFDLALYDLLAVQDKLDDEGRGSAIQNLIRLRRLGAARDMLAGKKRETFAFAFFAGEIYRLKGQQVERGSTTAQSPHPERSCCERCPTSGGSSRLPTPTLTSGIRRSHWFRKRARQAGRTPRSGWRARCLPSR